jgi:hypothetical protein
MLIGYLIDYLNNMNVSDDKYKLLKEAYKDRVTEIRNFTYNIEAKMEIINMLVYAANKDIKIYRHLYVTLPSQFGFRISDILKFIEDESDYYNHSILFMGCVIYDLYDDGSILYQLLEHENIKHYINFIPEDTSALREKQTTLLREIILWFENKVVELTTMLINKGADVNIKFRGYTPLKNLIAMYMESEGDKAKNYLKIIKLLLNDKTLKYVDIVSSIQYLNQQDKILNDLLVSKAKELQPLKYLIYTNIYSIITQLTKTKNTYSIDAHGGTMYGRFNIPDNICICVPVKTTHIFLHEHNLQLGLMERIYFPGYNMKNMKLDFKLIFEDKKDYSLSGVNLYDPSTYKKEYTDYGNINNIKKFVSDDSLCRDYIIQENHTVRLDYLVKEISKLDKSKVYCLFLATCREGQGNIYSSNNEDSPPANSHGIDILPSIHFKDHNRNNMIAIHEPAKPKIDNFKKKVKNVYNRVKPFENL